MKKMTVLRTILSLTLAAFLLCGCGNSKDEAPAEEVPEVAEEAVTEEPEKEEEEVVEEPQEETSTEMPEAQVTTTVADITEFAQYMADLDPKTPHIVIWNEAEGYVIDIGEGEYYHLKSDDKIYLNINDTRIIGHVSSIPEISFENTALGYNPIPDYSQFESPQEVWYGIQLEGTEREDMIYTNCYLYSPAE